MLKSNIIDILQKKHPNLNQNDIELIIKIFSKKIINSLKEGNKIEIRGFGTISKKDNKEKMVRNPKTNEKIFKVATNKIHFKIGKILHQRINKDIHFNNE